MRLLLRHNFNQIVLCTECQVGREEMFVDIFYFRTNREMPKMNPSLHHENIGVFSRT